MKKIILFTTTILVGLTTSCSTKSTKKNAVTHLNSLNISCVQAKNCVTMKKNYSLYKVKPCRE